MRPHYETGSTSVYDAFVAKYDKVTVNDPRGTFETRTNAAGMMEVNVPRGGWMSLAVAKRAGILK
jgi:hypothetical protein